MSNSGTQTLSRVLIERHPNPEFSSIHLDVELTTGCTRYFSKISDGTVVERPSYDEGEQPTDSFLVTLAEQLFAVRGVVADYSSLSVSQYELRIQKAQAFSDAEVEDGILRVLAAAFDVNVRTLDVRYERKRSIGFFDPAHA